ncbi:roadkill-like [Nasonia vitripennis]|uniref:Uncharacterized protein n=1 Tax=Nasonia vitripennis TaxID=7425 RepID=A0A7M6W8C1_NASVI|nr:roadkill-like [Nasonia vitripennis]
MSTGQVKGAFAWDFEWTINYECLSDKNVGDMLKSPVFTTSDLRDSYKWQLCLYPKSDCEKNKDFFSLYLTLLSNVPFKIKASLSIVTKRDRKVEKSFERVMNNSDVSDSREYKKFVKRNLIEKSSKTLHDNTIKIGCKIVVYRNGEANNIQTTNVLKELQRLSTDFEQLIDNEELNNIEFTIEGKKLRANRSILGKRSRTFAALFNNEISQKREREIEITDIRYEVFLKMMHYIYTGKMNGIENIASELLTAADKYCLDGLKLMCEKSLCHDVKTENVLDNLQLAVQHGLESLKAKTLEFIVTQAVDVVTRSEFRQLPYDIVCDVCFALACKKK